MAPPAIPPAALDRGPTRQPKGTHSRCSPSLHLLSQPLRFRPPPCVANPAASQQSDIPDPCGHLIRAWVDPVFGVNGQPVAIPGGPLPIFLQVDDISAPFKTIQYAIDAVETHLVGRFNAGDSAIEGIVYALPGLYAAAGNGEVLPINMRDRAHLQGQGARGCVIRGDGVPVQPTRYFLPYGSGPAAPLGEVLVNFTFSHQFSLGLFNFPLPWSAGLETSEMLDRFTFQGGDVQVLFYKEINNNLLGGAPLRGRVSNCLFDMRHNWTVPNPSGPPTTVQGPYFGIEMAKAWATSIGTTGGYYDQQVLIANNTFILAEMAYDPILGAPYNASLSRAEAVAIIDVTDTGCGSLAQNTDPDNSLRGVGNPIVVNNLFRTHPGLPYGFAMLGIDLKDSALRQV